MQKGGLVVRTGVKKDIDERFTQTGKKKRELRGKQVERGRVEEIFGVSSVRRDIIFR